MEPDLLAGLTIIGRILLGGAFVFAGIRSIMNASLVGGLMEARGLPMASTVLYAGIVLQIVAGVLLAAGLGVPYAAAALIVFLIAATPMFHNFWAVDGSDRAARINGWVSNAALVGGLMIAGV